MTAVDERPPLEAQVADPLGLSADERQPARTSRLGYLLTPLVLAGVCAALYVFVSGRELDSIEARILTRDVITSRAWEHVWLTVVSTLLVIALAVPVGILLTRRFSQAITPALIGVANIGQAVPSIAVLVLLALTFALLGFRSAVIALVAYSFLPVLRNTMVGLQQVDRSVIDAARGMGMTKLGVLGRIELPLAVPVIFAGVRTALVINVGTATLATYVNAGGLGDIISAGLAQNRTIITVVGSTLTAVFALFIDYVGGIAEDVLRPRGL